MRRASPARRRSPRPRSAFRRSRRDPPGVVGTAAVRHSKGFSATKVIDLTITASLDSAVGGDHVLSFDVFAPDGSLYRTFDVPFSTTRQSPQLQGVEGCPRPLPEAVATSAAAAPGQRSVSVALPVAGTDIVSSSLYGSWRARARLDGAPTPCSSGGDFLLGR